MNAMSTPEKRISGIVKRSQSVEEMCRVKIQRLRSTTPSAVPSMLVYSRCDRVPPVVVKDCLVTKLLGGRPKAYFVCKVEGSDLILLQETQHDDW